MASSFPAAGAQLRDCSGRNMPLRFIVIEAPYLHVKKITKTLVVEGQNAIEENDVCSIDGNEIGQPAARLEVILRQLGTSLAGSRMCGPE